MEWKWNDFGGEEQGKQPVWDRLVAEEHPSGDLWKKVKVMLGSFEENAVLE